MSVLRVGNLGVELNGVNAFFYVLHSGTGTVGRSADNLISLGCFCNIIRVAHPYHRLFGNVLKKRGFFRRKFNFSVFGYGRGLNLAARHPSRELTAVAYAQNGDAHIENILRIMGRTHIKNGIRAARKDYSFIFVVPYNLNRRSVRQDFRINPVISYAAGD